MSICAIEGMAASHLYASAFNRKDCATQYKEMAEEYRFRIGLTCKKKHRLPRVH